VKPLLALARTDIVLYLSNRRALLIGLAAPILIAAFFGSILGGPPTKPMRIPIAVVDLDSSPVSQSIVGAMKGDTTFDLREIAQPEAINLVRTGKLRAAIVIPAGFGDAAPRSMFRPNVEKPEIAVHYDPSQATTLLLVKGLLAEHVMKVVSSAAFSPRTGLPLIASAREDVKTSQTIAEDQRRNLLDFFESVERVQRGSTSAQGAQGDGPVQGLSMPFATREVEVTSGVDRKYNSYAHAFAGMGVQFILFLGIDLGIGVLLMRRQGIWKRLRAAPVSRALLLGSRIVSGSIIATILFVGIYAAAIIFFGVRIEGSLLGFAGVIIAFALLTSTFGLLIAAVGRTPEATRGLAILATLLLVMLGGAWVPTFIFPEWLQTATLVIPTRWAMDGLDAMTWRGLGIEAAWAPISVMLAFSATFAWIAVKRFNWEE
jgi:ABC-2 type transport system permease protein